MMVRESLEVYAAGSCCLDTISLLFTFDLFGAVPLVRQDRCLLYVTRSDSCSMIEGASTLHASVQENVFP